MLIKTSILAELDLGLYAIALFQNNKISRLSFNFPLCFLVKMTMSDEAWHVVKNTPKVTGFVGTGSKPVPLKEEEVERIVNQIEKAFLRAAKKLRNAAGDRGSVDFQGHLDYDSFRLSPREPSVRTAVDAVRAEGLQPELVVANGGLDANWLTARGIPTVSLGCGQRNIHTVDEELVIAEFHTARRIARHLATGHS